MKKVYVIIGASATGISAVNKLHQLDPEAEIICISKELELPYNKCKLARYLAGKTLEDELSIVSEQIATVKSIHVILGQAVVKIVADNKSIMLEGGQEISYDKLFIATGASAVTPEIQKNSLLGGLFNFHTLGQTNDMLTFIKKENPKHAVVVGSGMTGLECADALHQRGISVSIVEMKDRVLRDQSDAYGSELIENSICKQRSNLYLGERVTALDGQAGLVKEVLLQSGKSVPADMVIFAVGVQPNTDLAKHAGIKVTQYGIETDKYMGTDCDDIYAGGDTAAVKDYITQKMVRSCMWPDACFQGIVAAHAMTGSKDVTYAGTAPLAVSKFWGMKLASCGPVDAGDSIYEQVIKKKKGSYSKIVLKDGIVCGFLLVGDIAQLGTLRRALLAREKI